jgi:guanosine-3',5'-bis(diphosphate) 3'-pyrophosphohydrolase
MMRQYDLVERVRRYNPDTNEDLLNRAYVYAMKAHGAQTRASGDPYFSHPLEVAAILTDLKLDDATIVAALLHDTIEDTEATRAEIDQIFGHEIGALVEGLTKLKRLDLVSREAKQAENLRKLLLAIADDVRVLLVKLADRLHNMRTLDSCRRPRASASPRRRSTSMRRSPAAWACRRCARSSRTCRSARSIRKPMRWSAAAGALRSATAT